MKYAEIWNNFCFYTHIIHYNFVFGIFNLIIFTCQQIPASIVCVIFSEQATFTAGDAVAKGFEGSGVAGGECCVIWSLNMTDDLRRAHVEFGGLKNPDPDAFLNTKAK